MTDVLIIDGLNVFMRHFAANPTTSGNGENVGGQWPPSVIVFYVVVYVASL